MLTRWTRSLLRHRGIVIIVWVLLAVLGLMVNGALNARLSTSLSVPGSESAQANVILATHFLENVEGSFSIVVVADGQGITSIERRVTDAVRTIPTGQILQAKELS